MAETKTAITVVTAPPSVDMYTVQEFRKALHSAIETGVLVVADLNGVGFMDALGCGVLVGALRVAQARDCRFGIACDWEPTLRLFLLLGLSKVFDIRPELREFAAV